MFKILIKIVQKIIYTKEKQAEKIGVVFGRNCRFYGKNEFGSEPYLIELGDRVSLTSVTFITHDGGVWVLREKHPDIDVIKPIKVGSNVFIGIGVIIMPGINIGNNVVVGAGAIVTKDVPDNVVVAGVPAKVVSSLNSYENKSLSNALKTKGLSFKEKKEYLISNGQK